jgi:hypothetical protein
MSGPRDQAGNWLWFQAGRAAVALSGPAAKEGLDDELGSGGAVHGRSPQRREPRCTVTSVIVPSASLCSTETEDGSGDVGVGVAGMRYPAASVLRQQMPNQLLRKCQLWIF